MNHYFEDNHKVFKLEGKLHYKKEFENEMDYFYELFNTAK